jgi:hypothetical protein
MIVGDVLGPLLGGIRRAWNLDRKQAATVQDDGVFAIRGRTFLPSRCRDAPPGCLSATHKFVDAPHASRRYEIKGSS